MARSATPASLVSGAYGALARTVGSLWNRYGGTGWSRLRLFLPSARFDWEREASDTWMSSVVALGVSWLGDRFPRPAVTLARLGRSGDPKPVGRHDVVDLWKQPNPFYNRRTLEKAVGLSLKTDGNAYIYKLRDRGGRVKELWWLPHFRVNPTWPSDGSAYLDGYLVRIDQAPYWVPKEDMIHIRDGVDPLNERVGLAALKACLREVCTLNFASGYTAALMKNSGVPGIALVPDGPQPSRMDEDAAKRTKNEFIEKFSGDMVGSPIIMKGAYKLIEVGYSPEKLALSSLTRDAEARVASAVGVAAMSLGLPDPNKTYANLGEANRASWGTIVSIQELIADAVAHQLFPDFGLDPLGYAFMYDYSQIQELQESLDAVHARTRQDFRFDLLTRNEARTELGYDEEPDGDVYFSDVQIQIAQAKAPAPAPGEGGNGDLPSDAAPTDNAPGSKPPSDSAPTNEEPRVRDSESADDPNKSLVLANGHVKRWRY